MVFLLYTVSTPKTKELRLHLCNLVPTYAKCSSNHVYEWTRPAKLVAHINVSRNYLQTAFFNAVVLLALMEFAAQVNANSLLSQIEQIELR